MNGPLFLLVAVVMLYLLWKYSGVVKSALTGVGQAAGGLRGILPKNPLLVLLGVAGIGLVWWGYTASIGFDDVAALCHKHWVATLIVACALIILIIRNASVLKGTDKALTWMVLGAALILIFAAPVSEKINKVSAAHTTRAPTGQAMTLPKVPILVPPHSRYEVYTKVGYAVRFGDEHSSFDIHCVYQDGTEGQVGNIDHPCKDGPMRFVYLKNDTSGTISTTYQYVRFP